MKTINLTIPRSWDKLTPSQLVFISSLFLQGLTKQAFLLKAFICLAGLKILPGRFGTKYNPSYLFARGKDKFSLRLGQIIYFSKDCEFLLRERNRFNPVPAIGGRKARSVLMHDANFSEFISALVYYNQVNKLPDDRVTLLKLCAVMYPDRSWDPDNIKIDCFKEETNETCYTSYLWFGFVLNRVASECPDLFRAGENNSEPVSLRDNVHAMYNLVTGGDITKEKEVAKLPVWRVLCDMNDKARNIKEMNEKLNSNGI